MFGGCVADAATSSGAVRFAQWFFAATVLVLRGHRYRMLWFCAVCAMVQLGLSRVRHVWCRGYRSGAQA